MTVSSWWAGVYERNDQVFTYFWLCSVHYYSKCTCAVLSHVHDQIVQHCVLGRSFGHSFSKQINQTQCKPSCLWCIFIIVRSSSLRPLAHRSMCATSEGPYQSPAFFPDSLPNSTSRWIPNSAVGSSKNHDTSLRWSLSFNRYRLGTLNVGASLVEDKRFSGPGVLHVELKDGMEIETGRDGEWGLSTSKSTSDSWGQSGHFQSGKQKYYTWCNYQNVCCSAHYRVSVTYLEAEGGAWAPERAASVRCAACSPSRSPTSGSTPPAEETPSCRWTTPASQMPPGNAPLPLRKGTA